MEEPPSLIDLPVESSSKVPRDGGVIVQETYRPVTLTCDGERVVGGSIVTTSSPDKPQLSTRDLSEVERFPKTSPDHNGQASRPSAHAATTKEPPTHFNGQLETLTLLPEVPVHYGSSLHPRQVSDQTTGHENHLIEGSDIDGFGYQKGDDMGNDVFGARSSYSTYGGPFLLDEDIPHFSTHSPTRPYSPESIVPQYPSGIRDRMAALEIEANDGANEADNSEPLIDL